MGQVERNILEVALRVEVETRLVPGLLAVDALLLEADARTLARLPEWLDRVQTPLPSDAGFLSKMGRRVDPGGFQVLEENLFLLPGQSETAQAVTDFLWEMAQLASGPSLEP